MSNSKEASNTESIINIQSTSSKTLPLITENKKQYQTNEEVGYRFLFIIA